MAAPDTVTALQGDTLDLLLWRERGLGASAIPAVLEANRGVGGLGAELPLGTVITVPANAPAISSTDIVNLWD